MRWKYESMDLWFDLRTQKLSEVLQDPRAKVAGDTRPRTSGRVPGRRGPGMRIRGRREGDPGRRGPGTRVRGRRGGVPGGSSGEGGRGRTSAGVGEGSPGGGGRARASAEMAVLCVSSTVVISSFTF
jgi:hypothetical protein